MDLYSRMGEELRSLFKDLFSPGKEQAVRTKMKKILDLSSHIGGSIEKEAKELHSDVEKYLKQPKNSALTHVMKKHALRLEQETREI